MYAVAAEPLLLCAALGLYFIIDALLLCLAGRGYWGQYLLMRLRYSIVVVKAAPTVLVRVDARVNESTALFVEESGLHGEFITMSSLG